MFELPKVSKPCPIQIRALIDSMGANLSAMLSLGSYKEVAHAMLIRLVIDRLDQDSQEKWDEAIDFNKLSSWEDFSSVIVRRCQTLESRKSTESNVSSDCRLSIRESKERTRSKFKRGTQSSFTITSSRVACSFCREPAHIIDGCPAFTKLSAKERFNQAKCLGLCIKCLQKGHTVKNCSRGNCGVCARPHHTKLHIFRVFPEGSQPSATDNVLSGEATRTQTSLIGSNSDEPDGYVILATAIINVRDKTGTLQPIRALLDSASQINVITQNAAQWLGLKQESIHAEASGLGMHKSVYKYQTNAVISSRLNNFSAHLKLAVLPRITGFQPNIKIDIDGWNIPKNVEMADPWFNQPNSFVMLIGADTFYKVLSVGQIRLGRDYPLMQKTLLGWILAGKYQNEMAPQKCCQVVLKGVEESCAEDRLRNIVERFWRIENIESQGVGFNEEERACEELFVETVRRLANGSFMVKLPFKANSNVLGDSLQIAYKRFLSLERKLGKDQSLKEQYAAFLAEYESLGHMAVVPPNDMAQVKYYTPHQCVLRPESSTTKLRVVFDCSCKTSSNFSLNDILMVGPTVQDDLYSIILRFRFYKYALTADISKMYRQVYVTPNDSYYQCILWRSNPTEPLLTYRLKTVTYGTASVPYLATRCLQQIAMDHEQTQPKAARIIQRDFYIDDLITGANTIDEIQSMQKDIDHLLSSANFTLQKWYSNELSLLEGLPKEDLEKPLRINDSDVIKALGLVCHPHMDSFGFVAPPFSKDGRVTKRTVLSDLSRLFDPLGLISPVIVRAKIFMQELWKEKLEWDESLPLELHTRWVEFLEDISGLREVRVPRYVLTPEPDCYLELHGFADASMRAFGACIYARSIDRYGNVLVNLVTAKSRVAPLSTESLPRLEHCGALLLVELMDRVKRNITIEPRYSYLWTDSEVVLDWLSAHPLTWNTFVANRVAKIQMLSKTSRWQHVNSKANPADIVSRGMTVGNLFESIWFKGPEFLMRSSDCWPVQERHVSRQDLERRPKKTVLVAVSNDEFRAYERYSNFEKTCRIFAIVFRVYNRLKKKSVLELGKTFQVEELHSAFLRIVWSIQQHEFAEEIHDLQNQQEINSKSSLRGLCPFLDEKDGVSILRVGGRLKNAELPYDSKHPLLLTKNSNFIKTFFNYLHTKFYHAGPTALVAISRQRVWVVNARALARKVVASCIHCFRYRPKLKQQIIGNLPPTRVKYEKPFLISGVDFCGPIQTTYRIRGKQPYKSYIAVFVCFATKGTHLEVVSDLSANAFIASLKRFLAWRGFCQHLYCDNGTNFVGARNVMQEFRRCFLEQQMQQPISSWCSAQMVQFHHIPPRAPHFGGLWESAVKSAKGLLVRTLNSTLLTFEELTTECAEIEAILNSRPLCPLSTDPNDEEALIPAHFWNGQSLVSVVEPHVNYEKLSLLNRWQQISALKQHFWQRWSREYLLGLQRRVKWTAKSPNVIVGSLVLVAEDNLPPQQWLLGRILATKPGSNGHIRVVDIKTKRGILRRTVDRIAPLPIDVN